MRRARRGRRHGRRSGHGRLRRAGVRGSRPGAYGAPEYGAPAYGATPAAPAVVGSSGALKLAVVIAVIAVLAIVAVWFFVLRGPATTGEEFVGTWTATTQKGIATVGISKADHAFPVMLTGNTASQKVTVPAHLDGADLVITMDDFSQIAGEADADRFKEALKALAGDFRIIIGSVDATHLSLRIVGTAANGQDFDETIPLTKSTAGTT